MSRNTNSKFKDILTLLVLVFLIFSLIKNPTSSISNAKNGLYLWVNIIIPSLLPFMVLSHLMISLGLVNYFSKPLTPFIRRVFNVPGEGAFVFILSSISGYPMGAKLTSQLRKNHSITKQEADRLISFTNTSGPLFMLGSVAIGMLNNSNIAMLLLIPHILGSLSVGALFNLINLKSREKKAVNIPSKNIDSITRLDKSIGSILSSSVKNSINSLLLIGGFIIFYSVIIDLVFSNYIVNKGIELIARLINFDLLTLKAFISGCIELTVGCRNISSLNIGFLSKILMINTIIAWGGLSIHSQVISFISETDINQTLYIISKLLHSVFAFIYTYILYMVGYQNISVQTF